MLFNFIKGKNYFNYTITFMIAFIPRAIIACQMIPLRTLSDELATMASAAVLAGNNWSDVISNAGYYGFGFYWIFFIVFKITDNPIVIYRIILIVCCLVQSFVSLICLKILNKFFSIKDNKVKILFSLICSYCVVTRVSVAYNEHILILISWLITLLLCILWVEKNKIKKRIYTLLLVLLLAYSLSIHTRALTFFLAITIVYLFNIIFKKKCFISRIYLILFAILYLIQKFITELIKKNIWSTKQLDNLRNVSVKIDINHNFLSLDTWKGILDIWIGQITTISIFTCGVFTISILVIFWASYNLLLKKNKTIFKCDSLCLLIGWVFLLCIGSTIFAQSLTWLPGVVSGLENNITTKDYYGYKAFTYIRYFGPYIGPFIMCGLLITYHCFERVYRFRIILLYPFIMFKLYWFVMILPFIQNNINAFEAFTAFAFWKYGDIVNIYIYLCGFLILALFVIAFFSCRNRAKFIWCLYAVFIALIFEYSYTAIKVDLEIAKINYNTIDESYKFIKSVEPILLEKNINDIYVIDRSKNKDHQSYYLYQFYLNRYHIIPQMPKDIDENTIIITNTKLEELKGGDFYFIQLDKNQYIYLQKQLINKLENIDVSFTALES